MHRCFQKFLAHKIDEGHKHAAGHVRPSLQKQVRELMVSLKHLGPKAAVVDFSELFISIYSFQASTGRFCEYFNERGEWLHFQSIALEDWSSLSLSTFFDVVASAMWVKIQIDY